MWVSDEQTYKPRREVHIKGAYTGLMNILEDWEIFTIHWNLTFKLVAAPFGRASACFVGPFDPGVLLQEGSMTRFSQTRPG